jgi:hypothetical protein
MKMNDLYVKIEASEDGGRISQSNGVKGPRKIQNP